MNIDELVIAYSTDNNYAQHVGTSMLSVFESNKDFKSIVVYVIENELSTENKNKLKEISSNYSRKIIFINFNKYRNKLYLNINNEISISSYSRLFLASIIDCKYDRVLYFDCDSVILTSLTELWRMNIEDYYVAGVLDTVDKDTKVKIGLREENNYINAGMLLINLKMWREKEIEKAFINFINKYDGKVFHHDQGVINGVLNEDIKILSPRFNVMTPIFMMNRSAIMTYYKLNRYYTEDELSYAKEHPVFIHYTAALTNRPWIKGCVHPLKNKYKYYLDLTPWRGVGLQEDKRKLGLKIVCFLYNNLPFPIADSLTRYLFS